SAVLPEPPEDMAALLDWIRANPGRFTYPAPPDFNGSVFVRHVFTHVAGGADRLLGPFDQPLYNAVAAETWALLNDLEPFLWREGRTYPTSISQLDQLFSNGEVAFTFNYDPAQFGLAVEAGIYPETVRSYGFSDGTIGNTNYLLIPINAPNPAAAMVAVNLMLGAEAQLEKARPEVWGAEPAIDITRTPPDIQAAFAALPRHPAVVPSEVLAEAAIPELQADWIAAIEAGWRDAVGR
ncbi:MAG: ABC transporter substrate-binding protein, partial [Pseudomonadota bacterium]